MDEHMAALALTSLSCSPASPMLQSGFASFQRMLLTVLPSDLLLVLILYCNAANACFTETVKVKVKVAHTRLPTASWQSVCRRRES